MRSAVLRSLGVRDEESDRVVRFGLGRFTTRDEVERAAALVASAAAA
jgi:cysteine sulfinate desulfinase/cysteine desulfurase-like protein